MSNPRYDASREIRAPRGSTLNCKSWQTEAAFRMLQNNLDPEVAEDPKNLVVYGGTSGGVIAAVQAIGNATTKFWRS